MFSKNLRAHPIRGLLFVDESRGLGDDTFRVGPELRKNLDLDAFEDFRYRAASQLRTFGQLADQVRSRLDVLGFGLGEKVGQSGHLAFVF